MAIITPRDLYQAYGSITILREQWESITAWLDKGVKRGANGLWDNPRDGFQLADWCVSQPRQAMPQPVHA